MSPETGHTRQDTGAGLARTTIDPWGEGNDDRAAGEVLLVDLVGFEGPLDLLLALARTQKVDLAQISVLKLAEQYLEFIAELKGLRLELAADYLVMAARLHFRLQRLHAMRQAAAQLFTRQRLGRDVFPRGMPEGARTIRERQYSAELYDLIKAYADQRKRTTVKRAHVVRRRVVWSIKDARQRLERLVGESSGNWLQLDLFLDQYVPGSELSRTALASSFGASLEMAREGLIELRQDAAFAPIEMRRRAEDAGPDGGA
jgi:segregation and condensation protein A